MNLIYFILSLIVVIWLLIKGWIFIVGSIFNPKIKRAEQKEAMKNTPEPVEENPNFYVRKHFRLIRDRQNAYDQQLSIDKARKGLRAEYQEYLKWCEETKTNPLSKPPSNRSIKVYHID